MVVAAVVFSVLYFLLLMVYLHGWNKLKIQHSAKKIFTTKISVIVSARNEEKNIVGTLLELAGQAYPRELFEIILLDDDSTDRTLELAEKFRNNYPGKGLNLKIIHLDYPENSRIVSYKKYAISKGIEVSTGNWIVLTDADCQRGKHWLSSIVSFIESGEMVFVSAPVCFIHEKTAFQKMQSLEFLSLIGIGAASIANKNPNMCNGANIAFKKKVFAEVHGYDDNKGLASGDDEFLLHKIFNLYPEKVGFLKNREAIVYTVPFRKFSDFLKQRKRWVSKSNKYQRRQVTLTLYFVYLFHLLIFVNLGISIISVSFLPSLLLLLCAKLLSEYIYLIPVARFFHRHKFLPWYLPAAIAYVFYVVFIGIIGNSGSYEWKGRRVR